MIAIRSAHGAPGTAGALAFDRFGAPVLLTSQHILETNGGKPGDPVYALQTPGHETEGSVLGRAGRGFLGRVTHDDSTHFIDCGLIELSEPTYPGWLEDRFQHLMLGAPIEPADGIDVRKDGGATGETRGVIHSVSYHDNVYHGGRRERTPRQLLIHSSDPALFFSAPGDSGAAVVNPRGETLGLLWGTTPTGHSVACPIGPILSHLALRWPDLEENR